MDWVPATGFEEVWRLWLSQSDPFLHGYWWCLGFSLSFWHVLEECGTNLIWCHIGVVLALVLGCAVYLGPFVVKNSVDKCDCCGAVEFNGVLW